MQAAAPLSSSLLSLTLIADRSSQLAQSLLLLAYGPLDIRDVTDESAGQRCLSEMAMEDRFLHFGDALT